MKDDYIWDKLFTWQYTGLFFSFQISDFIVENPGDIPVLIQILPLPLYPNPQIITDLLYRK